MGTPHADRLYKMESWRTSALEDSHRHLASVSQSLTQIATGNREVAADLGLECATARAACASLDRLAGRMLTQADALKQIVKSSTDVLNAGIDARNESVEIQKRLSKVNGLFGSAKQKLSHVPGDAVAVAQIEAQRQAAHAEIDSLAKTSLSKLNDRTLAAIDANRSFNAAQNTMLSASLPKNEFLEREIRHSITQIMGRYDNGMTALASIGATAPFVGLLGTVWGIYHALINIGESGQMSIAAVAGPIGEALVSTAIGLFAAIPAVLAFNAFTRSNKKLSRELHNFGHDLHVQLINQPGKE